MSQLAFSVTGASGGWSYGCTPVPAGGGTEAGELPVTAGEQLTIVVGGMGTQPTGGYGGGGAGGAADATYEAGNEAGGGGAARSCSGQRG